MKELANDMQPIFQIGKAGIGETMAASVNEALEARELIKLSVLQNSGMSPADAAAAISGMTGAEVAAVIGRKIILYKKSENNRKIIL